jgi:PAS domain S-box-containing protein
MSFLPVQDKTPASPSFDDQAILTRAGTAAAIWCGTRTRDVAVFEPSLGNEGRLRLLIDAIINYAIYMLDVFGFVTSWNTGAQRLKGYAESEILGKHFSVFFTDEDQRNGLPDQMLETSVRDGKFETEGWRIRKDGSRFWAHVVVDQIRGRGGELLGFAKVTRDLTDSIVAEANFRRTDDQFRFLVQGVTDYAIYLLDPQGHISSWNLGAQRIKGYLPHEVMGRHFSLFYTPGDREKGEPWRALEIAAHDGKFEQEGWRVRKDGSVFWASVVIDPISDDDGVAIGFAKITRDLTQAKEAQLALECAQNSLFQSQKLEALGRLTGGVAHDFNNLLAVILGGLELVLRRLPEIPDVTPLLENAIHAAQRGAGLTQHMLAFARRQDLTPETVDLATLLHGMTYLLQHTLGSSITTETRLADVLGAILIDPHQLELALLNLAMNARDAMPGGGSIIIAAREESGIPDEIGDSKSGRYVCLSVTDTGGGMDELTLSRATEPFFTTKEPGEGTGLGLSMVHGLLEQSQGRFILKSRKGLGTVAELWLPVAVSH